MLLFGLVAPAFAQGIPIRSFTTADGLPAAAVQAIVQDAQGQLWVGTPAGMRAYFAARFNTNGIPETLQVAPVLALNATPGGELYVGTVVGLDYRDSSGNWQTGIDQKMGAPEGEVRSLYIDRDGTLWAGGENLLAHCKQGNCEPVTAGSLAPPVTAITEDELGRIWIASKIQTGTVIYIVEGGQVLRSLSTGDGLPSGVDIKALQSGLPGEMWAASDGGLVLIKDMQIVKIYSKKDGLASDLIWSLLPAHEGGMWVGSTAGLQRLDDGKIQETFSVREQLAGNTVLSLSYDSEGNLWVGTGDGISRLPLAAFPKVDDQLLSFQDVKTILTSTSGVGFIVTEQGVISGTPGKSWSLLPNPLQLTFYCLALDHQGSLWAGSDQGLAFFDPEQGFRLDQRLPAGTTVSAIFFDSQNGLWVGTENGLYHLAGNKQDHFDYSTGALGKDLVESIWETRQGDLWVGTLNGGASRYHGGTWMIVSRTTTHDGLKDDFILTGLEDSEGNVWFGTLHGLARLSTGTDPLNPDSWTTFLPVYEAGSSLPGSTSAEQLLTPNLPGDQVNALLEDDRHPNLIWAATSGGLGVINGNRVSSYTTADGLDSRSISALGQTSDGQLWIGGTYGLTLHQEYQVAPLLELGDLQVDNQVYPSNQQGTIVPYLSKRATYNFLGNDMADLDGPTYRLSITQRSGSKTSQTQIVETQQASYALILKPGTTYTVSVQAYDRAFNFSPQMAFPALTVKVPTILEWLADRPYFYLPILALLAFGLVELILFFRRRQLFVYQLNLQVSIKDGQFTCYDTKHNHEIGQQVLPPDLDHIISLEKRLRQSTGKDPVLLRNLGQELYEAMFSPDTMAKLQELGLGKRPAQLHLDLSAGPARLRALPWEFIYGGKDLRHLAIDSRTAIVHALRTEEEAHPSPQKLPNLRILAAWANPSSPRLSQLMSLEEEMDAIQIAVNASGHKGQIELVPMAHVKWADFEQEAHSGYDIVHFSGHGGIFDNEPVLYFEDQNGETRPVGLQELGGALQRRAEDQGHCTQLVVLNTCRSADSSQAGGVLGLAESLVSTAAIPASIGMGYPFYEDSAVLFSRAFYATLLAHGQVDHAVMNSRISLANSIKERRDWGIPRMYSRIPKGILFEWV